jgi:hypothetical protein
LQDIRKEKGKEQYDLSLTKKNLET